MGRGARVAVSRTIAIVLLVSMSAAATAESTTTNAELAVVAKALQPMLDRLEPRPRVEYPRHTQSIQVEYLAHTYKIHGRFMTGEVATNAHDEIGPGFRGFVLQAHLQDRGEVNQACTPQTIREPYWHTDLDVTPIAGTDKQVYWALSYAGGTPTNVLAELRTVLRGLEGARGKAPPGDRGTPRRSGR